MSNDTAIDDIDYSAFPPPPRTEPCRLYLISPRDVGGEFPEGLKPACEGGPVAAFQLRVKDVEEHELARLAEAAPQWRRAGAIAFIMRGRKRPLG